ncbi:MAG: exodeoxyribonuclease V subunit alpha [Verrucomicrobia bacterium]|nr:MAG: exodeoxyribonuclease V subunit alpha [Verrucomicrobiota bacterium]
MKFFMADPELEVHFIDQHFAALMNRLAKVPSPELELAAKLVSNFRERGDVCVALPAITSIHASKIGVPDVPPLKSWVRKLRASGVVGGPGEFAPLILDKAERLYLQRYWKYEDELGRNLQARLKDNPIRDFNQTKLAQNLEKLFPVQSDLQKVAAFVAATSRLCVISGAPGTGKTRTIVLICALLIALAGKRELNFALAAPTGKAAARLKETIAQTRLALRLPEDVKLPADASTIQRLLGVKGDSPHFRHDAKNPLPADVVIVDEASMIDLALLAKLFDAVRPDARVILVGDKGQLASVEAGSAFRDICTPGLEPGTSASLAEAFAKCTGEELEGTSASEAPIHPVVVELRRNYRFTPETGIAELSSAVNQGDSEGAIAVLKSSGRIRWRPTPLVKNFERELRERVLPRFEKFLTLTDPADALNQLAEFAVLCALRRGPFGAETVNGLLERMLRERVESDGRYHGGEPVIIVRNDYNVGLFNGDLGIVLPDASSGELRVFFRGEDSDVLNFAPGRLPAHQPAFALTVHKSQGSEFRDALVILPERDAPVLTRELLYTGVTRVRETVEVWATEHILRQTIERKIERSSGLRDRLWKKDGGS